MAPVKAQGKVPDGEKTGAWHMQSLKRLVKMPRPSCWVGRGGCGRKGRLENRAAPNRLVIHIPGADKEAGGCWLKLKFGKSFCSRV